MIHHFCQNGQDIILDVYSGAVHLVDAVAADMILRYQQFPNKQDLIASAMEKFKGMEGVDEGELYECLQDIRSLIATGKLFSKDPLKGVAGDQLPKGKPALKALCLHVAHACNLDCAYCFARESKGEGALMPFEVGKRALDLLVAQSGDRYNLEVDFFGGEPLLNWQVVKELVHYARFLERSRNKNFRFTLTTNGLLIDDDVIEFANREMHNVVLSLDGRQVVHDRLRKNLAGKGSYETVLPLFQKFVKARGGKNYYMRGTFTHFNPNFVDDVLHMADLGFSELSMEPVVCAPDDPYALTQEDMAIVLKEYERLAIEMDRRNWTGKPFRFYHYLLDLASGPCLPKRLVGCGSGTEYLAVTPTGELYPCHQFVGDEGFLLGNVWDGITKPEISASFAKCNICENKSCQDCWAKFYCAGACPANAYHATGAIDGIYADGCTLFKKRIECGIWLASRT